MLATWLDYVFHGIWNPIKLSKLVNFYLEGDTFKFALIDDTQWLEIAQPRIKEGNLGDH